MQIDHLVIAATTLEQGLLWTEQKLGTKLQTGGKHPQFGTHNALLNLGQSSYLEVISIDPDAPNPNRARWFELDHFIGEPRLIHWVARTQDLEARVKDYPDLGQIISASRGDLRWQITVPIDGHFNFSGLIPTLITWGGIHPTSRLENNDCHLLHLVGHHPQPENVKTLLEKLELSTLLEVDYAPKPSLKAVIQTPLGIVEL